MSHIYTNEYECDGCGNSRKGEPERLAEGLPFQTYCSDKCALSDGVEL